MKRILILLTGIAASLGLYAQNAALPNILEIASVEIDGKQIDIVDIPRDEVNHYFLHVGTMGFGSSILSIDLDPVNRLFVPLGDNLTDALARMEELKELYAQPKGTSIEIEASFGPFFPDGNLRTVKVSRYQPLLTNYLEFSLVSEERVTHLSRSAFNSLLSSLKFYCKLHPKEM